MSVADGWMSSSVNSAEESAGSRRAGRRGGWGGAGRCRGVATSNFVLPALGISGCILQLCWGHNNG